MVESALLAAYELATVLAPFLVAYAIRHAHARRTGSIPVEFAPAFAFVLYVFAVLYVTGSGTLYDLLRQTASWGPNDLYLIPFLAADPIGCALNVVLFLPLGFSIPLVWKRVDRAFTIGAMGFSFSLAIELSQLLNHRATDIDDLILNTLGALLGFALYRLWSSRANAARSKHVFVSERLPSAREPALYLAVTFAGHFFLFNEMGIAKLLYGF